MHLKAMNSKGERECVCVGEKERDCFRLRHYNNQNNFVMSGPVICAH